MNIKKLLKMLNRLKICRHLKEMTDELKLILNAESIIASMNKGIHVHLHYSPAK